MKRKILIATTNKGKLAELGAMLDLDVELVCLSDLGGFEEVVEDGRTFSENARKKALGYAKASGLWTLADDSGLVIDALGGAPGVHSARFSGEKGEGEDRGLIDHLNICKVLELMKDVKGEKRSCRFVCSLCLAGDDKVLLEAEGACEGIIGIKEVGENGFGYDPIFIADALGKTVGQVSSSEKNSISHRGDAIRKLKPMLAGLLFHMDELRQADEALRQSEEMYRTLVETVEMGVTMVDVDHNILFVNSGLCKMFGKKPEDLIGRKCYHKFEKREKVCPYCPGTIAMKTGKTETAETEGVRDDGERFSTQIMASPLYDRDNNPRGFIELVENISDRKRVESELHEYQERLRTLASKLTLSEEHERRRIAGGLHDSIIQPLVFIKMKLETLLNKAEEGEKLSASAVLLVI